MKAVSTMTKEIGGQFEFICKKEVIACCGSNCAVCPRYYLNSEEEMLMAAELWHRLGWLDEALPLEEIRCYGCSPQKSCPHGLTECAAKHGLRKCSACLIFPCESIKEMLLRSEEQKKNCRGKCSEEEYEILRKAFFEKGKHLKKKSE